MANSASGTVFGKRKEPHTIIIAQGDSVRHFTVRPWLLAFAGSMVAAFVIGHLLATSYLVLRDDLIGAAAAHQARTTQAYEDRIASLRAQVDRITSRQLLDQQLMEEKVAELIQRQNVLTNRHGRLGPILERASKNSAQKLPENVPAPQNRPDKRAKIEAHGIGAYDRASIDPIVTGSISGLQNNLSNADRSDQLFVAVNRALRDIEEDQLQRLELLAENTYETVDAVAAALLDAGLEIDRGYGKTDTGGPLEANDPSTRFNIRVQELDSALDRLESVKARIVHYPLSNPAKGRSVSSSYGYRRDPILGRRAMHSGLDFRAPTGAPIRSAGDGVVTKAGWNGGYGRMVEIDHGNGFTTRYAHMRKILVRKGQKVASGSLIGKVGSSGRSTGPHLHYEVRRNGNTANPLKFIKAGNKVSKLLNADR